MTRKDYIRIAAALQHVRVSYRAPGETRALDCCVLALADALEQDNPLFKRERFLKACGYSKPEPAKA
jgi:hypothetical protein